jgi:prevent-host-death family protein
MEASIRQLRSDLSKMIRRAAAGETITVRVRNRPVAQIVPIRTQRSLDQLRRTPGILWNGGKPAGLARGERVPRGLSVSDWVVEDRR